MTTAVAVAVFVVATAVVVVVAPRMAAVSEGITSRTRLGAALFGAVFLGASTSLPGIVVTVSAAVGGKAELAAANALGGIVAQTMFLALADIAYGGGALQRAAVSRKSTAQLALVAGLLALVVVAMGAPKAVIGIHVTTPLLVAGYLGGIFVIRQIPARESDNGGVAEASTTDVPAEVERLEDEKSEDGRTHGVSLRGLWTRYAVFLVALAASGLALVWSVEPIAAALGLQLAAAGGVLTALATSSPELLTALAAARRGSLRLAVGDIAGGNAFDVLFLAAADAAVLGALYPALGSIHVLMAGVALLLNAVLLMGFIRRGRAVGGNIAPESIVVLVVYVCAAVALLLR